ncbi:glycosyltransferase [Prochlorococcus marinus]|uniref:glycosyltransferase n=1 Tax=Prochlorococcus marinus TaxID=1219 RepID=UPI001ADB00C9|nr:glycosyltransferase [Prochlorococcus marinus]MBO8219548.1 glycosyltransferase [Prochlorococcus marinus CUG1416]MBW3051919.1 hypothetical protein [Prochlorococcus marinus str. MU1416]
MHKKIIILHILPRLYGGGAEKIHNLLYQKLSKDFVQLRLVIFDKNSYIDLLKFVLYRHKNHKKILFGWMYYGGLLAFIISYLTPISGQIISLHSLLDKRLEGLPVKISRKLIKIFLPFKKVVFTYPNKISMSQHLLDGFPKNKSIVVKNGIFLEEDLEIKSTKSNYEKVFKIGVLGRNNRYKNLELAINAFLAFHYSTKSTAKIYLKGDKVDLLSKYISKDQENLIFLDSNTNNVDVFFKEINLLIVPSICECSPLVIPEAIFSGTRVISTPTADAYRLIGNFGTITDDFEISSMVSAIKKEYNLFSRNKKIHKKNYFISMKTHSYKVSNLNKMSSEFKKIILKLTR